MKALSRHLEDYLKLRRQLGFKLFTNGYVLRNFVRFARQQKARIISTKLVLHWVTLRPNIVLSYRAQRLSMVRGFAKYLSTVEPRTEVPSQKLIPCKFYRREPFHYTDEQVLHLIEAARNLAPSQKLKGLTFATLLGLLAVTGMRVGEALALDRGDINCPGALLTIRRAKGNKSRLVPLHASTVQALQRYAAIRDEVYPQLTGPAFFVRKGIRLSYYAARQWYMKTACGVGLRHRGDGRGGPCGPRMHDLRHYFAIRTLLNWYRSDADVEARLPELATFLGHTTVRDTYWYLSAVPELLDSATRRWERAEKGEI
jgi:integrase/recombinase XerD